MARIELTGLTDKKKLEIKMASLKLGKNVNALLVEAFDYYMDMLENTPDNLEVNCDMPEPDWEGLHRSIDSDSFE